MSIVKQGQIYYLRRRVPKRYARVENRRVIWKSLKTDSKQEAEQKSFSAWGEMINAWEALIAGESDIAIARFEAAKNLAEARGFQFIPSSEIAALPLDDILDRIEQAQAIKNKQFGADAFLGATSKPQARLKDCLDMFLRLQNAILSKKHQLK